MPKITYKPELCDKAEELLANGKSKAGVCAHFEITRQTFYNWVNDHPEFKQAVDRGMVKCQEYWEELGKKGMQDPKHFLPTPWVFTMKNRFREDYAENKKSAVDVLADKLVEQLSKE